MLHHEHPVGDRNRRQPVRDDQRGPPHQRLAQRGLARGGGRLVAFSSVAGERGRKPVVIYGSTKAGQFIQLCDQSGTPLVFLQNTTGYIVGKASEQVFRTICSALIAAAVIVGLRALDGILRGG